MQMSCTNGLPTQQSRKALPSQYLDFEALQLGMQQKKLCDNIYS